MNLPFLHIDRIAHYIFGSLSVPIAVFIAVLSDGLVRILQNGSLWHCRIAVFIVKQSFSAFFILSYRDRFFNSNLPMGHSIGQFVLDSHLALKRHFYRTFSIWHLAQSYLMGILNSTTTFIINHCKSTYCLFDGYLIERPYYPYKTPKPLRQSGFSSPLPHGQRDRAKVSNTVLI